MRNCLNLAEKRRERVPSFYDAGAKGYDVLFGRVPRHFAPLLIAAGQLQASQKVLELATGTGLVAEVIANAIGS